MSVIDSKRLRPVDAPRETPGLHRNATGGLEVGWDAMAAAREIEKNARCQNCQHWNNGPSARMVFETRCAQVRQRAFAAGMPPELIEQRIRESSLALAQPPRAGLCAKQGVGAGPNTEWTEEGYSCDEWSGKGGLRFEQPLTAHSDEQRDLRQLDASGPVVPSPAPPPKQG